MNIALEYAVRNKILDRMADLPLTVFLSDNFHIISLSKCDPNDENKVVIKVWDLSKSSKMSVLPPSETHIINKTELYNKDSAFFIRPIAYNFVAYEAGQKQYSDPPTSDTQDKAYRKCVATLYNSDEHKCARYDHLWWLFMKTYLPDIQHGILGDTPTNNQRSLIESKFPNIWKGWLKWEATFLDSSHTGPVAPELLFAQIPEPLFFITT